MSITRFSAIVIYFGIMGLISTMALFVCGSISVLICLGFILRIYSDNNYYLNFNKLLIKLNI